VIIGGPHGGVRSPYYRETEVVVFLIGLMAYRPGLPGLLVERSALAARLLVP
jgi:hypothetical protein